MLNQRTSEEFYRYGQYYHDEAKRILTHMPQLPSKYSDGKLGSIMAQNQGSRLGPNELMHELEEYINQVLELSPLICNLVYLREFIFEGTRNSNTQGLR